jgi:hypothetical protein
MWSHARASAAEHIDGLRDQLRQSMSEAGELLRGASSSDSWFALAKRFEEQCQQLGSATYCLHKWPEPDDAHADIDTSRYGEYRRSFHWTREQ